MWHLRSESRGREGSRFGLVVTTGLGLLCGTLQAQQPDPGPAPAPAPTFAQGAPYRITVDQLTGVVEVFNQNGRSLDRWVPAPGKRTIPLASVPPRRPLVVELTNANPLLYRYQVSASVVARAGGSKSCTGIGSRFAASGALSSLTAIAGGAGGAPPPGFPDPGQTFLPPAAQPGSRGEGPLTESFLDAAAGQLSKPVATYANLVENLRDLTESFEDSLALAAELGESLPLDSLLHRLQNTLERRLPGAHTAAQVPLVVRRQVEAARNATAELAVYARSMRTGQFSGDTTEAGPRQVLALANTVAQADKELPSVARRLQGQLRRLELAREGTRQSFTLEPSEEYRRITIEIQQTGEFPDVPRLRTGREELFSRPVTSLLCEISVGVAFMDRTAHYGVENGVLVDRDASDERTAPAFMIHVAPSALPWVGALAGLGFGSQSRPDFYLGGSLRVLSPLLVNFGVVWQRGERKPAGLALGDPVTDPTILNDLDHRYQRFFFWGFSLGR